MKLFRRFTWVGVVITFVFNSLHIAPCYAQSDAFEDDYFVIIGAFSIRNNAVSFTDRAHSNFNLNANFALNTNRNLYYVYVFNTEDRTAAVNEANKLRDKTEFNDAWVYYGKIDYTNNLLINKPQHQGNDINPETEQSISKVSTQDASTLQNSGEELPSGGDVTLKPVVSEKTDNTLDGKDFYFKIYKSEDSTFVDGSVDVIDVDRARKIATYKGNAAVKVSPPLSKSDSILAVCNIFGYRKMQKHLSYLNPASDDVTVDGEGAFVVPFQLERLRKGDIAVMYNVYFFKDAAIMRPESRFEVNSLLELLNENEKYVIRIHGHTNGDAFGNIILADSKIDNFFSLSGTTEQFGSAKKLSEERANTIKKYLTSNGVNPNRMQIKAWGGRRPVQNKLGARAQENVRVEIEILDN